MKLGRGRFGAVYQVSNNTAVKIGKIKDTEFDIHRKLCHPNIVQFLGRRDYNGKTGLEMELCLDGTLWNYAHQHSSNFVKFMRQVLSALVYLHRRGIMHRDVKPGNILLHNGSARLADFGSAIQAVHSTRRVGTVLYMAPEVDAKETYDSRADVYSWAKTWQEVARLACSHCPATLNMALVPQAQRPYSQDIYKNWQMYIENS
jgi:serine/threonine protein kinase